ncbi:MAG: Hsp70 family protein [Myxococcales bacterium]
MRRSLGIDLGTTNSVAARSAQVLPLVDGEARSTLMPSVVGLLPGGGAIVGAEARQRRAIDPRNTIYASKRLMGENWTSYATRQFREQYPHELVQSPEGGVQFETRAGRIRPVEVASLIVSHLCMRSDIAPDGLSTVITVPTSFREPARRATLEAMSRAGFADVKVIEEPVATAIAYLQRASLRYAAVYDFGGGTFDFAVIDCTTFPFKVLGNEGDAYLGGDDIDRSLAEMVCERVLRTAGWDLRSEPVTFARLVLACEEAKCGLAEHERQRLDITAIDPAAPPSLTEAFVDRDMLNAAAGPLIRRTFGHCDAVLSSAGLRARDIQAVFLAGGSSRLTLLQSMVSEYFGRKLRTDLNPEHVVAMGASIAAARPELWPLLETTL